jgi:hypothetical protein
MQEILIKIRIPEIRDFFRGLRVWKLFLVFLLLMVLIWGVFTGRSFLPEILAIFFFLVIVVIAPWLSKKAGMVGIFFLAIAAILLVFKKIGWAEKAGRFALPFFVISTLIDLLSVWLSAFFVKIVRFFSISEQ